MEKELQLLPISSWKLIHRAECWVEMCTTRCCVVADSTKVWLEMPLGRTAEDRFYSWVCFERRFETHLLGMGQGILLGSSLSCWRASEALSTPTTNDRVTAPLLFGARTLVSRVCALGLPNYRWFLWKPWPFKIFFFYRKRWISLSPSSSYSFLSLLWHSIW